MNSREIHRLPITAIVVGLNESDVLASCLSNLTFCEKVLYFDLGSDDDSVAIAENLSINVIRHKHVPFVEVLHAEQIPGLTTDWVLLSDPDEIVPIALQQFLFELMEQLNISSEIGAVFAPIQYYFKGRALKGTAWGGINNRFLLAHKHKVVFSPQVHLGRELKDGYVKFHIPLENQLAIEHYWMRSWRQLISKHLRYLRGEGEARYKSGQRTSILDLLLTPAKSFSYSYFKKKGYIDGFTGLGLSVFWAWYQSAAIIQLWRFELRLRQAK